MSEQKNAKFLKNILISPWEIGSLEEKLLTAFEAFSIF